MTNNVFRVVFCILFFMTGCMPQQATHPAALVCTDAAISANADRYIENQNPLERAYSSVFEVHAKTETGRRFGTGFAIARHGGGCLLATALHTVTETTGETIEVKSPKGEVAAAKIVYSDKGSDLAFLQTTSGSCEPLSLSVLPTVIGHEVILISNTDNQGLSLSSGIAGRYIGGLLETDTTASIGSSGGAVLSRQGDVAGMVIRAGVEHSGGFSRQHFTYSLPSQTIAKKLAEFSALNQTNSKQQTAAGAGA